MSFDTTSFWWTREPKKHYISENRIEIITEPHTDLWQRTYYHFRNDNAPLLQISTREKFFSFTVKTDFSESCHRFDQCGVVVYLNSENWIKASVEYENADFQHLGSVVTNHGYSDWATTEIPSGIKTMWYRLSRRKDDFYIENSRDGKTFHQMRICHFFEARTKLTLAYMPAAPKTLLLKPFLPTLPWVNVCGKPTPAKPRIKNKQQL